MTLRWFNIAKHKVKHQDPCAKEKANFEVALSCGCHHGAPKRTARQGNRSPLRVPNRTVIFRHDSSRAQTRSSQLEWYVLWDTKPALLADRWSEVVGRMVQRCAEGKIAYTLKFRHFASRPAKWTSQLKLACVQLYICPMSILDPLNMRILVGFDWRNQQ